MHTTPPPESDRSLLCRIVMAGGHERICGGLEVFISRARACLTIDTHVFTETPGHGRDGMWRYLRAIRRFAGLLRSHDIVWLHYGSAFDLTYLLVAKLLGKRVAVTPHLGGGWRTMRHPVLRTLCNRILSLADLVFTLHETQPAALHFPERVRRRCVVMGTFLPQAVLAGDTPVHNPSGPLRLVHVARLSADKGSFAFIDVCGELRRLGTAFEATMIGQAEDNIRQALTDEIARQGLPIALREALPQTAFLDMLRRQDVLVNLSLQDAYPLTVIEALLCGVAPVCTALPGTRELAADAPVISLVEGQDAQAAAARITAIDWSAIPSGASALRRKFDWTHLQRRYSEAFAALAGASSPPSRQPVQVAVR